MVVDRLLPTAEGVSVHVMSLCSLLDFGTPEQRETLLPELIAGAQLGAYAQIQRLAIVHQLLRADR